MIAHKYSRERIYCRPKICFLPVYEFLCYWMSRVSSFVVENIDWLRERTWTRLVCARTPKGTARLLIFFSFRVYIYREWHGEAPRRRLYTTISLGTAAQHTLNSTVHRAARSLHTFHSLYNPVRKLQRLLLLLLLVCCFRWCSYYVQKRCAIHSIASASVCVWHSYISVCLPKKKKK